MRLEVHVPTMLRDCTGNRARFEIEAITVKDAIRTLLDTYPLLRVHMYTEAGALRKHVLIFYNEDNLAWLSDLDVPVKAGDRLSVVQAVSGG